MKRVITASARDFNLDEHIKFNDKYFPRVDISDKSRYQYYRYRNKDFAYDLKNNVVMKLFKDDDEVAAMGKQAPFRELDGVGLQLANWKKVALRNEYLDEWIYEMDADSEQMAQDFIKYELPHYQKDSQSVEGAYDTGEDSYDPELDDMDSDEIETVTLDGKQYEIQFWDDGYIEIGPVDISGVYLWAKNKITERGTFYIYRSDNDGKHLDKMSNVVNLMNVVRRISQGVPSGKGSVPDSNYGYDPTEFEQNGRCKAVYNRVNFSIREDDKGTIWISSIHPYDLTEYHYAYAKANESKFRVCRDGKLVTTVNNVDDFMEVIKVMYHLDAKLPRRMDRT